MYNDVHIHVEYPVAMYSAFYTNDHNEPEYVDYTIFECSKCRNVYIDRHNRAEQDFSTAGTKERPVIKFGQLQTQLRGVAICKTNEEKDKKVKLIKFDYLRRVYGRN